MYKKPHKSTEVIFITSLVMFFLMFLFVLLMRSQQLPNVAEVLPAEHTQAFLTANTDEIRPNQFFSVLLDNSLEDLDWYANAMAIAWVDEDLVKVLQVQSTESANEFFYSLKVEDEEFENYDKITCFTVSQPLCFAFEGSYLFLASERPTLEKVLSGGPSVATSPGYQNVKGRLPFTSSAFFYSNLTNSRLKIANFFGQFGIYEPAFLETVLQIFPAFGMSLDNKGEEWYAESFTAVDKSRIGGEAFFRPEEKYRANFLPLTSGNTLFEWGGQDLSAQWRRISEILEELNPSLALIFDSSLSMWLNKNFGETLAINDLHTLFDKEYYLGWTPDDTFLFILELDKADLNKAGAIKDFFRENYQTYAEQTLENGEVRATRVDMDESVQDYEGTQYFRFQAYDEMLAVIVLMEDKVIVSNSREELFNTLDIIQSRQDGPMVDDFDYLLRGSDELSIFNVTLLPEGHILSTFVDKFQAIHGSRKIFDDGFFSRYSMQLK